MFDEDAVAKSILYDFGRLERELPRWFSERNTIAVAESITGGLIGSRITDVAGSSAYFVGGVVTYSNAAKAAVLRVPEHLLASKGAVSDVVARNMADGVRRLFGANVGLSVTGIAGPDGATPVKPVGLTYVALAGPDYADCRKFQWDGDRLRNKRLSAEAALLMLVEFGRRIGES